MLQPIVHVDDGLGKLLDALSRLGLERDTIVVFTSVRTPAFILNESLVLRNVPSCLHVFVYGCKYF